MEISRKEATNLLSKTLGFRVVNKHVEFVSFDEDNKVIVRAVHPVQDWQEDLWNQCIQYLRQVMGMQFDKSIVEKIEVR